MARAFVFALVAFGMAGLAANESYAADGGRWYPFYGYHQPSYLNQPSVVYVQPSAPQASTSSYPPAPGTVAPAVQYSQPQCTTGSRWYPFYGYHRPNLN